jgi:putative endopeptidase
MMFRLRAGLVALGCLSAVASKASSQAAPVAQAVDRSRMDTTCAPCRDFYRYAIGAWFDRTLIRGEYTFAGVDREVRDRTEDLLHEVLDQSVRTSPRHLPRHSVAGPATPGPTG